MATSWRVESDRYARGQNCLNNWENGPTGTSWSSIRTTAESCDEGGITAVLLGGRWSENSSAQKDLEGKKPCGSLRVVSKHVANETLLTSKVLSAALNCPVQKIS